MNKICLITPGHISTNPRLVKEATVLANNNYKVHIIFSQYVTTQIPFDDEILRQNQNWSYDSLNWTGNNISSSITRLIGSLYSLFQSNPLLQLNRNISWQIDRALKANADLYIAHNLGALPVAVKAAKQRNAKCGFDAEDFHRNETTDDPANPSSKSVKLVEDNYIPEVDYLTAASPLISDLYSKFYKLPATTIANVFPRINVNITKTKDDLPLQLFWFSQTVGPGRGLETIVEAINMSKLTVHLHLLGQPSPGYVNNLNARADLQYCQLFCHDTIAPDKIFEFANGFDIGLASELKSPLNRDICLTNKIFTYIQSGLPVFASDTTAQKQFLALYPTIGKLYRDEEELAALLIYYHVNRDKLNAMKAQCLSLANSQLNWEIESNKFIHVVKKVLAD